MNSGANDDGLVLYCDCARTQIIPEETRRRVRARLERCGRPVLPVSDLCGLAAARDPRLDRVARAGETTVVACYPRAVRWLFHWAGSPLDGSRIRFLNMRVQTAESICAALAPGSESAEPAAGSACGNAEAVDPDNRPWFPVIDYARCSDCGQCREFCLFGVYAQTETGRVEVRAPSACKDNCPACARICPEAAIMFPKIDEHSPISGSDEDPAAAAGKVRLTREQLFGAGALDRLRSRQRPPLLK